MGEERSIPKRGLVVAIDGPAGAGKSTLALALATALGLPYVNTGLMYRALAHLSLQRRLGPDDEAGLAAAARALRFDLGPGGEGGVREVLIGGRAPGAELTSRAVEAVVSRVARHAAVRAVMRRKQRALGAEGSVVEGRDIGSVVFPDADVKIFLRASPEVRAGRRIMERGGTQGTAEAVARRDELDAKTNPLAPAPDAHVLDSTAVSRERMVEEALGLVRRATDRSAR